MTALQFEFTVLIIEDFKSDPKLLYIDNSFFIGIKNIYYKYKITRGDINKLNYEMKTIINDY